MASLKEIKNRISSISSTKQITSAMKLVSAAKLKRGQDKIVQVRPYANKFTEILQEVSAGLDKKYSSVYSEIRPANNVLIVLIASNRGLCGAFNSNICKFAVQHVETNYKSQLQKGNVKFLTIGKKAHDYIIRNHYQELKNNDAILDDLTFANTTTVAESLMSEFLNKNYDKVEIIYNSFKNAAIYYQIAEQFLPVNIKTTVKTAKTEYILEPDIETIVEKMLPKSLKVQLHKIILDSFVAEQGARMTAMHQATDNATELIKELTLV